MCTGWRRGESRVESVGLRIKTAASGSVVSMTGKAGEIADAGGRKARQVRSKAADDLSSCGREMQLGILCQEFLSGREISVRVTSLKLHVEGLVCNTANGHASQVKCKVGEKEKFRQGRVIQCVVHCDVMSLYKWNKWDIFSCR